jgi:immunoglobulin-binding protein 1
VAKEELQDKDDEAELRKQREWDDWKDDNKRGSGNRFNRS